MYQNVALYACAFFLQAIQDLSLNVYSAETRKEPVTKSLVQSVAEMFLPRAIQVPAQLSDPSVRQRGWQAQAEQPGPGGRWRV